MSDRHAMQTAIEAALRAANLDATVDTLHDLSGGCIHRVMRVVLTDGTCLVAKVNRSDLLATFDEEVVGLSALAATRTIAVPQPMATIAAEGKAVLLMTHIDSPRDERSGDSRWTRFGEQLAALHSAPLAPELSRGFGFVIDNHLGSTPQPNAWQRNWATFNAEHRFGHQIKLAATRGLLFADELRPLKRIVDRLPELLPHQPRGSLLHGDLWSGNVLPCFDFCAILDPAPHVGDALADIAMMKLFGGFPAACFNAWAKCMRADLNDPDVARRIAAYQLYHVLNHINIFGRGYVPQAMAIMNRIGA